ncbi:substrate-binding and VWA domain-containing protein [Streptosporangium sp. NBC_01756]|uniref:substrate-binding and VWA domain-containing protein n=1 Tax=Streptosporangium sp. NBC_01756 TaxID=2975950 RepID=UPI002DD87ECE|nr:substrate-binding and VWA domain-containing protein [Streptosporangium sp. NBC_01756]WSC83954.1 substrate-binding and VWA domain-containing protein [Streptosporangium sp. NBC_01756]
MYEQPQRRRRNFAPFVIAIILAGALIVGLRLYMGGTEPSRRQGAEQTKACGDGGTTLTVAASSEKAELLRELAAGYNGREVGGRCADVVVETKASGGAMQALARGWDERQDGPRPDVWSPASSGWVTLLQQRATGNDTGSLVAPENPSIAKTPLVIAMPKPMAEALGWPGKKLGWSDLLDLSAGSWAKYDHPEWGRFRLGKTNPNFSTSGLNATVGAYFAATGLSGDLSERNVADAGAREFVRGVERSIVHYGDTTLTFLSNLQRADDAGAGLSYISAVAVEEKSVWDYNQGNPTGDPGTLGKHGKPKVPLVAIYPKEGTLSSDNPYAVLTAPWVDDAKRKVAADFLAYLQAPEQQQRFADAAFRSYEGKAGKLITKANGLLPAEPETTLSPPAPNVLDKVLSSWSDLRKPANVLMVIDVSGSMGADVPGTGESKLDLAKQAAINALPQFGPHDKVGLWMFSTKRDGDKDHLELAPLGPVDDAQRKRLKARINGLTPDGGTGLYDTSLAAYRHVRDRHSGDAINAVVFLTDGKNEDTDSVSLANLLPDLRAESAEESVRMFTIAYGQDADLEVLRQISETTDAAAYDSRQPGSIDQVFTAVVSNF